MQSNNGRKIPKIDRARLNRKINREYRLLCSSERSKVIERSTFEKNQSLILKPLTNLHTRSFNHTVKFAIRHTCANDA